MNDPVASERTEAARAAETADFEKAWEAARVAVDEAYPVPQSVPFIELFNAAAIGFRAARAAARSSGAQ